MAGITIRRRVYYDDTDSGGVVYHTNYLRYMEHARTDYLHRLQLAPHVLDEQYRILFVVAGMNIRYMAPARLGDELEINATLLDISKVAARFSQSVFLLEGDRHGRELVCADVKVVCVDSEHFKPVRIPQPVRESMARDN